MNKTFRLAAGAMLLALSATLVACHGQDPSSKSAAGPMELRLYDVPVAQSKNLAHALALAMAQRATVSQATPGKVLVYAPSETQASIGEAIAALAKAPMQQVAPRQVDVHFWVVSGEPGAGPDDAALKPLASALDSVRRNTGSLHFSLVQTVSARTSTDGHNVSITAAPAGGNARSFVFAASGVDGQTLGAEVDYHDSDNRGLSEFKSEVNLQSGQYVVLAQGPGACVAAALGESKPPCPVTPVLRLLIVRADILPSQT
jgi:hypothetical protein